jgi:phenylacetate-CoA ligase
MISTALELRRLLRNRYLSPPKLRALQESKLRALIRHSYDNVPYYRSLFRSAGLSPEDVQTIEDLEHVPVTTKDDLRAAGVERAVAKGIDPASCRTSRSSGTSGKVITVYYDGREARTRNLVGFRGLLAAGIRPRDRLCCLRPDSRPPGFLGRLGLYRREMLSWYLPMEEQTQQLRKMRPTVLMATPSQLTALLHHLDYRLSQIVRLRALIAYAEVLDENLRKRIQADAGLEVFDSYMAAEFMDIAAECPAHQGLHVNADRLILECLDDDAERARPGEPGVVVITSLSNHTMSFIRYRLGDASALIEEPCSCGSSFPLIAAPFGRQDDLVRLPSGRILSAWPILWFLVNRVEGIEQYRVVQETLEHVVVQLEFSKNTPAGELAQLRSQLLQYLGEPVGLDIEIVDFIQEEGPKLKKFILKLPPLDS